MPVSDPELHPAKTTRIANERPHNVRVMGFSSGFGKCRPHCRGSTGSGQPRFRRVWMLSGPCGLPLVWCLGGGSWEMPSQGDQRSRVGALAERSAFPGIAGHSYDGPLRPSCGLGAAAAPSSRERTGFHGSGRRLRRAVVQGLRPQPLFPSWGLNIPSDNPRGALRVRGGTLRLRRRAPLWASLLPASIRLVDRAQVRPRLSCPA